MLADLRTERCTFDARFIAMTGGIMSVCTEILINFEILVH